MEPDDLNQVEACEERYDEVMDALNRVVQSSRIGVAVFSFGLVKELCVTVRKRIEAAARSFCSKPMSLEALSVAKFNIQDGLESLPNFHLLPPQRDISVFYGSAELHARVSSLAQEAELRFAAVWKAQALRSGVLQPLWCEDVLDVGVQNLPAFSGTFDDRVVRHVSLVRAQCAESFKQSGITDREMVMNVVKSHKATWLMGDASFSLELAMISAVCGDGSEHRLAQKVLATLPSAQVQRDVAEVYQIVHAVGVSNAYKLATVQAQAKHRLIMKALALLCDGVVPDLMEISKDPILAPLVTRIGMFATCRVGDKVLVGGPALREVHAMAKAKGDKARKDCELLKLYDFFVPQDIRQDVRNIVAAVAKMSGKPGHVSLPLVRSSSSKDKGGALEEAAAMFA